MDDLVPREDAPIMSEEFFQPLTTDLEVNGSGFGSKELDFAVSETPSVITTVNHLPNFCFASP